MIWHNLKQIPNVRGYLADFWSKRNILHIINTLHATQVEQKYIYTSYELFTQNYAQKYSQKKNKRRKKNSMEN